MADQESALTLTKSNNFLSSTDPMRVWILTYPDKTTFYLTDEERTQFLTELANGNNIIQIEGLTLTTRFTYMYQFKNKPEAKEYEQVDKHTLRVK
jgi:hypothetical protein